MPDRRELEALFLEYLPVAEKILGALARRHALTREDAEEFAAWAKLRIIENDYAILAKFRGESTLPTYLSVVIAMLYREYRVQRWGRWRPSAAARRSGDVAVRLETLTQRDGMPLHQAGEILRTSGATSLSDRELAELAAGFPSRNPLRPVEFRDVLTDIAGEARADEVVAREEADAESDAARQALDQGLAELPTEDRLIVRLHFLESMTVAEIARGLALPQKPLYRRIERALESLRSTLERAGISRDLVRGLVAGPS